MSRRLRFGSVILLVVIWAGVLLTPKLRLILGSQIASFQNWDVRTQREKVELKKLVQEYPNDPRILAVRVETIPNAERIEGFQKARLHNYDALIKKFPREAWLIKNRLRFSVLGVFDIDTGMKYQSQPKSWLSQTEILQALKIAEGGARLEPENSFYDWMRAIFFFGLKRPQDALRALHEGARKPHFDDGVDADMKNKLAVQALQGAQLWEDRNLTLAAIMLPHYAPIRTANYGAVWQATLAERQGNHQRALEICGDQMRLAEIMRHDSKLVISELVAQNLSIIIWDDLTRRIGKVEKAPIAQGENKQQTQAVAHAFAIYAQKHDRPDLAKMALQQASLFKAIDLGQWLGSEQFYVLSAGQDMREIYRWKWIGLVILHALFWCTLACCIAVGLQRLAKWRFKSISEKSDVPLSDTDVIAGAIFVALAFGTVLFAAWRILHLEAISDWMMFAAHGFDLSPIKAFNSWLPYVPLTLAMIYGFISALWRGRKAGSTPSTMKQGGCVISACLFVLVLSATVAFVSLQIQSAQQMNLDVWAITSWIGLFAPVFVCLVPIFYLAWRFGRAWFASFSRAFLWLHRSQLISQTLLVLLVALSGAYLFTSVASLPIRHEANARLDDFLARGEVAVLRDTAKKNSP